MTTASTIRKIWFELTDENSLSTFITEGVLLAAAVVGAVAACAWMVQAMCAAL